MTTSAQTPEQLTLLPTPDVPVRFRLDEATRRRGLQHIAEIRALLHERTSSRSIARRPSAPPAPASVPVRQPQRAA